MQKYTSSSKKYALGKHISKKNREKKHTQNELVQLGA